MKLTPERLEILKEQARKNIPASFLAAGVLDLITDLEESKTELENERARGIHSCHDNCARDGCVNRKLRDELADLRKQLSESGRKYSESVGGFKRDLQQKLDDQRSKNAALKAKLAKAQEQLASPYMNGYEAAKEEYRPQVIELESELNTTRKQLAEAQAKLAHLAEYWNRDENEIAMKDACWHTAEVAEASDTSALDAAIAEAVEPYRKDAERLDWLEKVCKETPLNLKAFGSEIAPDTRLRYDFPTLVSYDAIGQKISLRDAIDTAIGA